MVVKRGEYGALYFSGEEVFAASAVPLPAVFDPTGAGDSFAGGFMGYLARAGRQDDATMRRAIVLGGVLASFTVEQFSLDRLRSLTPDETRAQRLTVLYYGATVMTGTFFKFLGDPHAFDVPDAGGRYFYAPRLALIWCAMFLQPIFQIACKDVWQVWICSKPEPNLVNQCKFAYVVRAR